MNKQLTTILTTLLLFVIGATNAWSQSMNYQSSYDTNFLNYAMFAGSSSGNYVGLKNNVLIGGETYPIALSYTPLQESGKTNYPYIKFMVPKGTRYLYLHGIGSTETLSVKVYIGTATQSIATREFHFNSNDFTTQNGTVTFQGNKAKNYYVDPIDLGIALPANTVIRLESSSRSSGFAIYGVYYEDGYSPHKGTTNNPFTAGEANALANDYIKLTDDVYVKGMVTTAAQLADGKLSFSISDDGSHTSEIAASNCSNISGADFNHAYQVLPRDKVKLKCKILPQPNASLTSGTLISQVHPSYEVHLRNEGQENDYPMTNSFISPNPADWPIQSCGVGHLYADDNCWFYIKEKFSDDTNYEKSFYAPPAEGGGFYLIGWENMDQIPLTDLSSGRLMRVNTEGDNYALYVEQVEDGPKLTVGGFENPRFFLHRESDTAILAELELGSDFVYRARGIDVQTGEGLYITKGENGSEFYCSLKDSYLISQDNCANLPVATSGQIRNFKMSVTGTFDFSFFVDTSNGSATFSVSPSWGEWPEVRPIYWLCYSDGEDVSFKFHDNGDGTYTLTDSGLDWNKDFWFKRQFNNGPIEQYAGDTGYNVSLHKYNSTGVSLNAGGQDFKMLGSVSEKTFTITETAEGPELTITGWPETYISLAYDSGEGPTQSGEAFDYDEETDTYSFTYTLSKEEGFYFIDTAYGLPFFATTDEALTLSRRNSTDILASFNGSRYFKVINDGTYTFKLTPFNDSYLLTVEGWPEPIYKFDGRNGLGLPFVKNEDGSYSTTINVTEEMLAQYGDCPFDIYEETEDMYYGTSLVEGGLNRYNCVDLPLGTGERYYNITLYEAGEYTLTISPDFKLSIGWPHKDYLLTYRPADSSVIPSTVPFDYYAGNYTVSNLRLREGDRFWVQDKEGNGFGIQTTENVPVVNQSNSSNISLVGGGKIASIGQVGKYTFTMSEADSSADYDLQMDITGWAARTFALRMLGGTYDDIPLVYDSQNNAYKAMATVKKDQKFVVVDNFDFTFGVPSSAVVTANGTSNLSEIDDENSDFLQMGADGTFTFLLGENTDGMYILVENLDDLIASGDAESGSSSNYLMKETPNSSITNASVVEGAGKDGSKAFVIHSIENPMNSWDSQFFINLDQPLPEGTKYRISFDYKADQWAFVETQIQSEPGSYITYDALGTITFNSSWQHFDYEGTVTHAQSPSCNMRTFVFMLAYTLSANTYYFDNIEFEIVKTTPWVNIINNGDCEGSDMSSFKKVEQVGDHPGEIVTANFTEGVGKNGSRGIVVKSRNSPDPDTPVNDWDTQFFVSANQTLPAGTKYRISFDYRASTNATAKTQIHADPGTYLNYVGIGDVNFNLGWQHFEKEGVITSQQSPNDEMRTIGFNLAVSKSATTYYFDNFVFEIDEDHVAQVLPGDVNGDGTVSIQDVVLLVDYTLNKPVSGFVIEAADVTGDGQINVSDVVGIVNIVLKGNSQ